MLPSLEKVARLWETATADHQDFQTGHVACWVTFVVPLISERPLFDCLTSVSGRWLAFASRVTAQGLEITLHDALALLHMCYLSEEQAPNNIFIQEGKRHMTSLKPL